MATDYLQSSHTVDGSLIGKAAIPVSMCYNSVILPRDVIN